MGDVFVYLLILLVQNILFSKSYFKKWNIQWPEYFKSKEAIIALLSDATYSLPYWYVY